MSKDIEDIVEAEEEYKLYLRFGKYQVRRVDKYNIVVEELRIVKEGENAGREYPINIGYYKRLYNALEKVLQLNIETKTIKSLTDITKALKDAEATLYKELDSTYKDIEEK